MKRSTQFLTLLILVACTSASLLFAEQWLMFGGNPQHDSWAREETVLNKDNVKSLKVIWTAHIDTVLKEMNGLTAPVVAENVLTAQGHKDIVVVAGASDTLDAVDIDTGKVLWHKQFTAEGQPKQQSRWLCPNSLNATPVIQLGGGATTRDRTVHAIASDGKLHSLNIVNGEDRKPPVPFVPEFSKNWSLNLVNGILYTSTSQGCNGAKSGVYAMDLNKPDRPVTFFQTGVAGAGVWGRAGVTVGTDGNVYAETGDGPNDPSQGKYGDTFLSLAPKDLKPIDYYTPSNWVWLNRKDLDLGCFSPVFFRYKQRDLVAGGGKEGRLMLLDAKSLGGANHSEPLYRSPIYSNEDLFSAGRGFWGAPASWEDPGGTRWIYVPAWGPVSAKAPPFALTNGAVNTGALLAFKVEEKDGKPILTPAWLSPNMGLPEPPIVANGVVYSVSSGEDALQADTEGHLMNSGQRIKTSPGHAVLHAFDAETGKELYNSGEAMPAISHFSGIAISNGRVFITTLDSNLYSFGLDEER
ncbi:MAG TPA: PQQ-binding-like beta-propeller repeat protein [Bryobacteraceae bacterium]|nr:PQQ-binding-like beta-propeller repeat protein [Bryobacteraceae bacterium]